jgi:hypothetical protein
MEQVLALLEMHLGVGYAKLKTTLQWPIQSTMICGPSVANVVEDIGLRMWHKVFILQWYGALRRLLWRKINTKPSNSIVNYLEVSINDEEATINELNKICGANHHLTSGNKIPKRKLSIQANEVEGVIEQAKGVDVGKRTKEAIPNSNARSKILLHFMKGQIFLTPMESIMNIPKELEYLERLVKLARRRKDEEASKN